MTVRLKGIGEELGPELKKLQSTLLIGGAALMGTLAFGGQKYFEYQQLKAQAAASAPA